MVSKVTKYGKKREGKDKNKKFQNFRATTACVVRYVKACVSYKFIPLQECENEIRKTLFLGDS